MKKFIRFSTLTCAAVALLLAGCTNPVIDLAGTEASDVAAEGEAVLDLSIYVPAYRIPATGRTAAPAIIDPGTEYLRLYLNGTRHGDDVPFGTPQQTADGPVQNLQLTVPVPLTGKFESVRIALTDAGGNVLTRGETRGPDGNGVEVVLGTPTPISIACFPVTTEPVVFGEPAVGSLEAGTTTYFKFFAKEKHTYEIVADAVDPEGDVDVFVYDATGKPIASGETPGEPVESFAFDTGAFAAGQNCFVMVYALTDIVDGSFTMWETNLPPVAIAGQDKVGTAGDTVSFDSTGSYDPEGANVQRTWSVEDEAGDPVTLDTPHAISISVTLETAGTYTVTLDVEDEGGAIGTDVAYAYIDQANVAPVAIAPEYIEAKESDTVVFDGGGSYDPNDDPSGGDSSIATYSWAIADETGTEVATYTEAAPSHVFDTPGDYTATLTVTDTDGAVSLPFVVDVHINANRAPTAIAADLPDSVTVGADVALDATASFDPDDEYTDLTFDWVVYNDTWTQVSTAGSMATDTASYTFDQPGEYYVEVTVTDPLGDSDTASVPILVESVFRFNVSFAQGVTVDAASPVVIALLEIVDQNGDQDGDGEPELDSANDYYEKVADVELTVAGEVTISTLDVHEFSPGKTYGALVIHDVDNDYNPTGQISQALQDLLDYIGIVDSEATGGLLYDTATPLPMSRVELVRDTAIDLTLEHIIGSLDVVVK